MWNLETEKERCLQNKDRCHLRKNMHTTCRTSFVRIQNRMDAMKNFTPLEDGNGCTDAFLAIMGKEFDGRRRLYGRGVTKKNIEDG